MWHLVAEFEIDAIEEVALAGVRHRKQAAELGPVGEEFAAAADPKRQVEAGFPPIGDAIGEFGGALQATVRRKAAREFRLLLADRREIQVLFIAPLADIIDIGVINLDFVMDLVDGQG